MIFLDTYRKECCTVIIYSLIGSERNKDNFSEKATMISISEDDIKKLKRYKAVKIKDYTKELYLKEFYSAPILKDDIIPYHKRETRLLKEYKRIEQNKIEQGLTSQVLADISSLKKMISKIEDDGTFLLASCHSAWVHTNNCIVDRCPANHDELVRNSWKYGFMEQLLQLTEKRVNLIGITGFAIVPLIYKDNTTLPTDGHFYAKRNIGLEKMPSDIKIEQEIERRRRAGEEISLEEIPLYNTFLSLHYFNNLAVLFPTTYDFNDDNRRPQTFHNLIISPYKVEWS